MSSANVKEILNVKVRKSCNIETNHYLPKINVKLLPQNTKKVFKNRILKIYTEKLKSNKEMFQNKLFSLKLENWETFKENILKINGLIQS